MIDFLNQHFVNLKINKDENQALADQYGVQGIPATLFLDAAGEKVGEIGGYLPSDKFLTELQSILEKSKKFKEESDALKARLAKDPADVAAHYELGKLLVDSNSPDKATEHLDKVVELDKDNAKGLAASAHYYLGYTRLMKNDIEGGQKHFAETSKLDPEGKLGHQDNIDLIGVQIQVQDQGDLSGGLENLDKFLAKWKESDVLTEALFIRGLLLYRSGKRTEGLQAMQDLVRDHKGDRYAEIATEKVIPQMQQEMSQGDAGHEGHDHGPGGEEKGGEDKGEEDPSNGGDKGAEHPSGDGEKGGEHPAGNGEPAKK